MIENALILGGGTCGCQIAWQCALHGIDTTLVETDEASGAAAWERLKQNALAIAKSGRWSDRQLATARDRILLLNYQQHGIGIDQQLGLVGLVIESVPESLEIKRAALARIKPHINSRAIITTNSSYLLPSAFIRDVSDATRLASLHFHVPVWYANAVDIMPHHRTADEVVETLAEFAQRIDQTPIRLRREQPGYLFNSLLNPLLTEAIGLARRGVADRDEIDLSWRVITKMAAGPFDMIRLIGPSTVAGILRMGAARTKNPRLKLDADYLEQADLGPYIAPTPAGDEVKPHQERWVTAALDPRLKRLPQWNGTPVVLGDSANEISRAMADRFRDQAGEGLTCHATDGWPVDSSFEDSAHLIWHIDRFVADTDDERLLHHLQAWWTRRLTDPPERATTLTLVGHTTTGLSGLTRAMAIELAMHRRFFPAVRLVEYGDDRGYHQAKQMVIDEIAIAQRQVMDGSTEETMRRYADCHIRYTQQGRMRPVFATASWWQDTRRATTELRQTEEKSRPDGSPFPGGRWLLIGGGRGITFEMAMWLGQCGASVDLVESTRPITDFDVWDETGINDRRRQVMRDAYRKGERPDIAWSQTESAIEVARNLDLLRRAQVVHQSHCFDIASDQAVERIGQILGSGQRFDGVLYGAQWERSCRFEKKSGEELSATIRSGLVGLRRLADAINVDPTRRCPRWLVVNGSRVGVFGGNGQVDYAHTNSRAAAMMMAAATDWPECQTLWIDWPVWQRAEMAERPAGKFTSQKADHRMITVEDGLRALRHAIEKGG
jgi:3-hydroxyacyl-CoA dehydrogenase